MGVELLTNVERMRTSNLSSYRMVWNPEGGSDLPLAELLTNSGAHAHKQPLYCVVGGNVP